jgi:hypothetical protein
MGVVGGQDMQSGKRLGSIIVSATLVAQPPTTLPDWPLLRVVIVSLLMNNFLSRPIFFFFIKIDLNNSLPCLCVRPGAVVQRQYYLCFYVVDQETIIPVQGLAVKP